MTHYLRDARNNTLVDADATKDDLGVVVCIDHYSPFLLGNQDRAAEIIRDFDNLQELRGEFFESGWKGTPDELCALRLKEAAAKYNLAYVTD